MFAVAILVSGAVALTIARPVIFPVTHTFEGVFLISSIPAIVAAVLWWVFIHDPPCESAGIQAVSLGLTSLRKVIARPDLWLVALLFLLHNIVLYTMLGWIPAFLVGIGAGATSAGLITSVSLWAGTLSIVFLTRLSTKLGRRKPFLWGSSILLIFACAGVLLVNVPASWALMFLVGVAAAIRFAMILALPVEIVSPEQAGSASGLVMSVGYLGALAGPVIGGAVLDATGSFHWIFISLAVVSALTAGIAFAVPETGRGGRYKRRTRATIIHNMSKAKLTPATGEGPFYKKDSPEKIILYEAGVPGEQLTLTGHVFDLQEKAVAGAWLDFWQANGEGNYDNAGYVLRGHQFADRAGKYKLETVVPGHYTGRTPHIHVKVRSGDGRSILTTQLFMPDLATNKADPIFRDDLVVAVSKGPGVKSATFDFVIDLS